MRCWDLNRAMAELKRDGIAICVGASQKHEIARISSCTIDLASIRACLTVAALADESFERVPLADGCSHPSAWPDFLDQDVEVLQTDDGWKAIEGELLVGVTGNVRLDEVLTRQNLVYVESLPVHAEYHVVYALFSHFPSVSSKGSLAGF